MWRRTMEPPRAGAERLERSAKLPRGDGDRFVGYGFSAIQFASGDVIGLRRWAVSSIGTPYTSLWHRQASGAWNLYSDAPAEESCGRYIGPAIERDHHTPIRLHWPDHDTLRISATGPELTIELTMTTTVRTALVNLLCGMLPGSMFAHAHGLALIERVGRRILGVPDLRLRLRMPSGHRNQVRVHRCWHIASARARWGRADLGTLRWPAPAVAIGGEQIMCAPIFSIHSANLRLDGAFTPQLPNPRKES